MILEVCADSVQSALNAEKGGADRIEFCQNLHEGGTTPSWGAIQYCIEHLTIPVFVLIRPRSGSFYYSEAEFNVIKKEIISCKKSGIAGIVTGFLNEDFSIDLEKTKEIVELAYPMDVTFHRAFDISKDWQQSLQDIISCGCHRILSSGCRRTALEGADILRKMQTLAQDNIIIMAGSGITPQNAREIISVTGVHEIHSSCKKKRIQRIEWNEERLLDKSNYEWMETDISNVKDTVAAMNTNV